jgi:hypothetical protein
VSRRAIWIVFLGLACALLFGAWFLNRFEQVEVDEWSPPGREARHDSYLAMGRFLKVMGRPLEQTEAVDVFDHLPRDGVLILDANRRSQMTPERTQRLLEWVRQGGYLIAVSEGDEVDDPIAAFFKVNCGCKKAADAADEGGGAGDNGNDEDTDPDADNTDNTDNVDDRVPGPGRDEQGPPEHVAVVFPGAPRVLDTDFIYGDLELGDVEPLWHSGADGYLDQIAHFRHGAGNVTLVSSIYALFDNRHIGHRDHAELLWTLLQTYQAHGHRPVVLVTHLSGINLWEWLAGPGRAALLASLVLLVLWLWSVVPRFGPAQADVVPARRELREHLSAIGRYVWRAGGLEYWLETARASLRERLALRHPEIVNLPPPQQAQALADLSQRPLSLVANALTGPADTPQSFMIALRTLRTLERLL